MLMSGETRKLEKFARISAISFSNLLPEAKNTGMELVPTKAAPFSTADTSSSSFSHGGSYNATSSSLASDMFGESSASSLMDDMFGGNFYLKL